MNACKVQDFRQFGVILGETEDGRPQSIFAVWAALRVSWVVARLGRSWTILVDLRNEGRSTTGSVVTKVLELVVTLAKRSQSPNQAEKRVSDISLLDFRSKTSNST